MATAAPAPERAVSRRFGTLELLPAHRLTVISRFQRTPKPARVRALQKTWHDWKVGCLHVVLIMDGEYKGKHHIVDGGTRWAAMYGLNGVEGLDRDYVFPCYVEKADGQRAAELFLAENDESMKPSAFARFRVGTAAKRPASLAVLQALNLHGIVGDESRSIYGDGESGGLLSALGACDRIVHNAYHQTGDWDLASSHLSWTLGMTRRAWPQHGSGETAHAHNHDIIQAVAYIGLRNPEVVSDEGKERDLIQALSTFYKGERKTPPFGGMFDDRQAMKPPQWKTAFAWSQKGSFGGSESRGQGMGKLVVQNLHRHVDYRLKL